MIKARKIYEEMNKDIERYENEINNINNNNYNNNEINNINNENYYIYNDLANDHHKNIDGELPSYNEIQNLRQNENKKEKNEYDIDVIEFNENSEIKFEQKECLICIGEFEIGEKLAILKCNHCYHDLCLKDWIKKVKGICCPLCQASRN